MDHPTSNTVDIAIVGMACRFPGEATGIDRLWDVLENSRDVWTEIPASRLSLAGWFHPDPNRLGGVSTLTPSPPENRTRLTLPTWPRRPNRSIANVSLYSSTFAEDTSSKTTSPHLTRL